MGDTKKINAGSVFRDFLIIFIQNYEQMLASEKGAIIVNPFPEKDQEMEVITATSKLSPYSASGWLCLILGDRSDQAVFGFGEIRMSSPSLNLSHSMTRGS